MVAISYWVAVGMWTFACYERLMYNFEKMHINWSSQNNTKVITI